MSEIVTAGILVIGDEILSGPDQGQEHRLYRRIPDQYRDRPQGSPRRRRRRGRDHRRAGRAACIATTMSLPPAASGRPMTTSPPTASPRRSASASTTIPRWWRGFASAGAKPDLNEARLRMARIPDGAELIQSATILAPGFKIGNVIVMAGVPSIMQAMMDIVAPKLKSGVRMLSDIGARQCARRRHRRPAARDRQRPSRHHHRQLPVPSTRTRSRTPTSSSARAIRKNSTAAMAAVKEMLAGSHVVASRPFERAHVADRDGHGRI